MHRVLTIALALALIPLMAKAQEGGDTIRVLVPSERRLSALQSSGTGADLDLGWTRVEVPLRGGRAATLAQLSSNLGPNIIIENHYELLGGADEPLFDSQWGLENTGQFGGLPDADIDAETAWSEALGAGVRVAVIDSGVDSAHPDLSGQVTPGWDTVDGDSDPSPVGSGFDAAHGTMVAGVIAGAVNDEGIAGVAPEATIVDFRACDGQDGCWSLDVAEAIYRAVDQDADIINLSLGSMGLEDLPLEAAIDHARANGVVVIAAVGNQGEDIDNLPGGEIMIPAGLSYDNIISVGATDNFDQRASYSNYGSESTDLFAPGDLIHAPATAGLEPYQFVFGTSFAAPHVSGAAALLLSKDPGIAYQELIARVTGFAENPNSLTSVSRYGRLSAGRTMTMRFIDTSGSVFVNAIDWLADESITEGCNPPHNHRYCPNDDVTRGEMAVFFSRAFDLPSTEIDYFTDDEGRFYEASANRMAAAGITVGCGRDRYCGDRDISREEMAAMLARALKLPAVESDYFEDDNDSIFQGAINRIADVNITEGCNPPDNDHFCPTNEVTRGQMSAFIKRAFSLLG